MAKLFLDTEHAAAFLGLSRRTFERKYVDTKKVQVLRFGPSTSRNGYGDARHIFLRTDLEKLKRDLR